jgi:hypothetical protein
MMIPWRWASVLVLIGGGVGWLDAMLTLIGAGVGALDAV